MTECGIAVRRSGSEVRVRVVGRATAVVCPALRSFLLAARAAGARDVLFDLGQCVYMDSTFMGILTMAALDAREAGGRVRLANAGAAPRSHLASLGVESLFAYVDAPADEGPWEPLPGNDAGAAAGQLGALGQTALAAHEALGTANPDNVPRFQDVIEALRREAGPPGPQP